MREILIHSYMLTYSEFDFWRAHYLRSNLLDLRRTYEGVAHAQVEHTIVGHLWLALQPFFLILYKERRIC